MKDLRMLGKFDNAAEARDWFYRFLDKAHNYGFNNALYNDAHNGLLALKWLLEDAADKSMLSRDAAALERSRAVFNYASAQFDGLYREADMYHGMIIAYDKVLSQTTKLSRDLIIEANIFNRHRP